MNALPDRAEREQIRTVLDRNVLVEAAAGTGKTTALIGRIIEVIVRGAARVQGIAALTFTEKAAGELKLRLRSELEKARTAASGESLPRIDSALLELEEARVSTIHTFCADLLRERPVEAGVDPAFRVLSESEAGRLLRLSVDFWIQRKLNELPEGLRRILRRIPRGRDVDPVESLRRAVHALADWRDFTAAWRRDPFDRARENSEIVTALHTFADLLRDCDNRPNENLFKDTESALRLSDELHRLEELGPIDDDLIEAQLIHLLRRPFISARGAAKGRFGPNTKRSDVRQQYESLLARLRTYETNANAGIAALLHDELQGAIADYEEQKRRLGVLDFVDLLIHVRDLLWRNAAVRAHFQERISHIFVDEFQDTDPIQVEILMLLASDDARVSDWRAVQPKPGKLFLVGDPKQSIYRFRRADLGMYEDVKQKLKRSGALTLDLSTSFRSVPDIQSFANAAFATEMDANPHAQQARYVPLKLYRDALPDQPAVVALPVPKPYGERGITDDAVQESLPDAVAAYVEWLLTKSNWKVTAREDPAHPRDIEPRDICILFRRFETAAFDGKRLDVTRSYVHSLEARGIAQLLVGGKSFHGREEIETMRTALAAVEWPEDELSVYATLRGALFGITDEELFEYRHLHQRLKPFAIPSDLPPHLSPIGDALRFIASLHGARNYRPVAETLRRLFSETRCHAGFVLRPSGKQVLANVMQLMEQARVYDESGALSFRGFIEQLIEEAEYSRASEAPVLEEGSEGVRLMTVHKAKGLEFPIVILADVTCNQIRGKASRYVDGERSLAAMEICGMTPLDVIDHQSDELERDRAEAVRLTYVAATRARDLLVIPAIADQRLDGKWLSVLNPAVYPDPSQKPTVRAAYPQFGKDATTRPYDFISRADQTVKPGTYRFDGYEVTWWDTRGLRLDVPITLGIPQQELLGRDAPPGLIEEDTRNYESWRDDLASVVRTAATPSIIVRTAIERSQRDASPVPDVEVIAVDREGIEGHGTRFGELLHAVLASIDLDAAPGEVRRVAELQSRIFGAPPAEVASVTTVVSKLLAHSLMRRAAKSQTLRREVPITLVDGGELIEGNVDLAFEEATHWTVVDFKTDAELAGHLDMYKRQVGIYAEAIAKATGAPARGLLVQV